MVMHIRSVNDFGDVLTEYGKLVGSGQEQELELVIEPGVYEDTPLQLGEPRGPGKVSLYVHGAQPGKTVLSGLVLALRGPRVRVEDLVFTGVQAVGYALDAQGGESVEVERVAFVDLSAGEDGPAMAATGVVRLTGMTRGTKISLRQAWFVRAAALGNGAVIDIAAFERGLDEATLDQVVALDSGPLLLQTGTVGAVRCTGSLLVERAGSERSVFVQSPETTITFSDSKLAVDDPDGFLAPWLGPGAPTGKFEPLEIQASVVRARKKASGKKPGAQLDAASAAQPIGDVDQRLAKAIDGIAKRAGSGDVPDVAALADELALK